MIGGLCVWLVAGGVAVGTTGRVAEVAGVVAAVGFLAFLAGALFRKLERVAAAPCR